MTAKASNSFPCPPDTIVPALIEGIPKGCTDIEVDQEGNIYLLQTAKHRIHKFFASTGFDSVQVIGGKGIGDEGFNFPSKLMVLNRQSVWVLDQMNRRIVQLNTNLKVVAEINFLTLEQTIAAGEPGSFWPISFAVGPSGEMYFLNQEDIKIYKFRTTGQLERSFGGLDYGNGNLREPVDLQVTPNNLVVAVDTANQQLTVFDLFGTHQFNLSFPLKFRWKRLVTFDTKLILVGDCEYFIYDLFSKQGFDAHCTSHSPKIVDLAIDKDQLYILSENSVFSQQISRK